MKKNKFQKSSKKINTNVLVSKKAQIKMMENIGILVVFFILIALGFIFYARIGEHSNVQDQEKYYQQRAVKLAQLVGSLPEVRCSEDNIPIADCFDVSKIIATEELIKANNRFYFDILSFSKISIHQIYPTSIKVILYDKQPLDRNGAPNWNILTPIQIPITLYNAPNDNFNYGILEVGIYER